ncbi:MAG: IS66 family transposase [Candidatus Brocadiaceae bacterium]|nr:IS66 family transposase [Candidatus Brocadiaceae bacterium]
MKNDAEKLCEAILKIDDLELKNGNLEKELSWLKRQMFGQKSEQFHSVDSAQTELNLFDEPVEIPGVKDAKTRDVTTNPRKRTTNRNPIPDDIECEEIIIEPEDAGKVCSCCGEDKIEIGREENKVLEYIPAHFIARNYIRPKYACKHCSEEGVTIADTPNRPIDKGIAESGLLAYIMVSKFVDHLPLYRLEQIFSRYNVRIPRSTMGDWVDKVHKMLEPIIFRMKERMLATDYIQADETTIKVQEKNSKKKSKKCHLGYLWPYTDGEYIVFEYKAGRGKEGPVNFLGEFSGYLQTDGYTGYNKVVQDNGITHVMCWAHARRKFFDALEYDKEVAELFLTKIGELYAIEKNAKDHAETADDRFKIRSKSSPVILEQIKTLLDSKIGEVLPKSPIGKAILYAKNHWKQLTVYVEDGRLEIDNNRIENKIRPVALGRKNWLFAGSQAGAERAALFYSIFGSCKIHGINPFEYLKDILEKVNTHPANNIDELLPMEWKSLRNL